jgi:hypothetical protein
LLKQAPALIRPLLRCSALPERQGTMRGIASLAPQIQSPMFFEFYQ